MNKRFVIHYIDPQDNECRYITETREEAEEVIQEWEDQGFNFSDVHIEEEPV